MLVNFELRPGNNIWGQVNTIHSLAIPEAYRKKNLPTPGSTLKVSAVCTQVWVAPHDFSKEVNSQQQQKVQLPLCVVNGMLETPKL